MVFQSVIFLLIMTGVILGLIPAIIAYNKGHSFMKWWVSGFFTFIPALQYALALSPVEGYGDTSKVRRCPFCLGNVRIETRACSHCYQDLPYAFKIPEKYSLKKLPPVLINQIQKRPVGRNLDHAKAHIKSREWHEGIATLQFIIDSGSPNSKEYAEAYNILYQMLPE